MFGAFILVCYSILNFTVEHKDKNQELRVHVTTAPSCLSLGASTEHCLKTVVSVEALVHRCY